MVLPNSCQNKDVLVWFTQDVLKIMKLIDRNNDAEPPEYVHSTKNLTI